MDEKKEKIKLEVGGAYPIQDVAPLAYLLGIGALPKKPDPDKKYEGLPLI